MCISHELNRVFRGLREKRDGEVRDQWETGLEEWKLLQEDILGEELG